MTRIFRIVWEHNVPLNSKFLLHTLWDCWNLSTFRLLVDDRDLRWIFVHLSWIWCICLFLSLLNLDEISQVLYGWLSSSHRVIKDSIFLASLLIFAYLLVRIAFGFRLFFWSGVRGVLIQIVSFKATYSNFSTLFVCFTCFHNWSWNIYGLYAAVSVHFFKLLKWF